MTSYAIGTRHIALCSDGKKRSARIVSEPDTFFSVPATVKVNGKTVTGFIYTAREWTDTPEIQFTGNAWLTNAGLLPHWLITKGYHELKCENCGHVYGKWGDRTPTRCVNDACAWRPRETEEVSA